MGKKVLICMFIIAFIVIGFYLLNLEPKDDIKEIQKAVMALEQYYDIKVAHIEIIKRNKAIAFYEWGHGEDLSFGNVILEKNFLGWEVVRGGSLHLLEDSKLNWGHLELGDYLTNYTDLLRGKITDPEIEKVHIITKDGKEYQARVVEYHNDDRFWFVIANGELLDATVTGLSFEGDVIEKTQTSY
ncbi:hypothetical protein NC661_03985 [Aquibacillus koreensis]|uniref:Uncharacterized protein n=1 Tax=Aquibacillus koreensis TaxID=279446 RepID=A0A9X3WLS8_9BACI|nr:hypothetical protein [Aquibacillus koreensis]MCT2534868.1 hypothetical protein [Aquibacillus koreensis]MDC3419521.1 hypothetical protein [Aquibacillus koreensis]